MKQGINSYMRVDIDFNFEFIDKIEFIFVQQNVRKQFTYPSDVVTRVPEYNAVDILWSADDTYEFIPDLPVRMDTKIYLNNSDINPETDKTEFQFSSTLFRKGDVE